MSEIKPNKIQLYLAKHFLKYLLFIFIAITLIIYMGELIENFKNHASKVENSWIILKLSLFHLPDPLPKIFPFMLLFAAMLSFGSLDKNRELIIMRASGLSIFKIMLPVILSAFMVGIFYSTMVSPLSASILKKYERYKAIHLKKKQDIFNIDQQGIWIQDIGKNHIYFIFAQNFNKTKKQFKNVTFYRYRALNQYQDRIDADEVFLNKKKWFIPKGTLLSFSPTPIPLENAELPSSISLSKIKDYFLRPEHLSFWKLRHYITNLSEHGFSTNRYELYYQSLLAMPFIFVTMVLFAGIFSFQRSRLSKKTVMIIGGLATGFLFFFTNNMMRTLGANQEIPIWLAAWGTSFIFLALAIVILIQLEE